MREWHRRGFFPNDLRVAPTFVDDTATPTVTRRLYDFFDEPDAAFAEPPDDVRGAPPPKKRKEAPKETGHWLQDSINRQKAGIHRRRHDRHQGPTMLFDAGPNG
mmetsp:Transcript_6193/g.19427  ORF Transcript_6193/g.19427 Transcript_6193/m.19427 type:complete len:104 (+) Transcript_6193:2-313(+)